MISILFMLMAILFCLSMPVGFVLAVTTAVFIQMRGIPIIMIAQRMVYGIYSFPILAIPFFILAGRLMNTGGVTDRIFGFATALVGHIRGGLAHANIVASMIFAGMSGAALADMAGLGQIEVEAMRKQGYSVEFAAAITGASSTVGPIIPPSVALVLYGAVTGVSIGRLLIGGLIPGILMGLSMMLLTHFLAIRRNYPASPRATLPELMESLKDASLALLAPVIIIGGILSGVFTPTEAAAIAAFYAFFLGVVVYRELGFADVLEAIFDSVMASATICFIVSAASVLGWIITLERIPHMVATYLQGLTSSPYIMLFLVNLLLLFLGCILEMTPILVIVPPILLPMLINLGIDPVHFGVVMVLNITIGLLTPPFGMGLFILLDICNIRMQDLLRELTPYLALLLGMLFLITYWPQLVLFLPNLLIS